MALGPLASQRIFKQTIMDMPFDGFSLFSKKADLALEHFKESRVTARSLGLSTMLRQPHSFVCSFCGYGTGY